MIIQQRPAGATILALARAEKLLLLQIRERLRRQIRVEEWRKLLLEELESSKTSWKSSIENLVEKANGQDRDVVMYVGLFGPLRDHLVDHGFSVSLVKSEEYWRSPIEVLRTLMWLKGPDHVSDEEIERCVREQMRYLDLVLSCESLDIAHEKWSAPFKRTLIGRGMSQKYE
jgi:hypothetical protein